MEAAEREREREMGKTERLWATTLSSLVAAIPALMIGFTFAFPSSAILDLTAETAGLPEDYRFSLDLADIFAVRSRNKPHQRIVSNLCDDTFVGGRIILSKSAARQY